MLWAVALFGQSTTAANQAGEPMTLTVTSRLVYLDVTVVDRKGAPVVTGLTRDDFTVVEDKKPQPIRSFEAPEEHQMQVEQSGDDMPGNQPLTIFVLDRLNSSSAEFSFLHTALLAYLSRQPVVLASPAELVVVGNNSLEMVQGYTRSRDEMLASLARVDGQIPYKLNLGLSFENERFQQSISALQQLALQSRGVGGRKNIVWLGRGGPGFSDYGLTNAAYVTLQRTFHDTTNLLVDSRITLFMIYPGMGANHARSKPLPMENALNDLDPFAVTFSFATFVHTTGGELFFRENDVTQLLSRALTMGSDFYTLTYSPSQGEVNGRFRTVHVQMRDPNLRAITKTGYYAPQPGMLDSPQMLAAKDLVTAAVSTVPFDGLTMLVDSVLQHPDTSTVEIRLLLEPKGLGWQSVADGSSTARIALLALSLNGDRRPLAWKREDLSVLAHTQTKEGLFETMTSLSILVHLYPKTTSVRVAVQVAGSERTGTVEVSRAVIDKAPAAPTPLPQLITRPARNVQPTPSQ